ncbi:DUF6479 family protein [Kitasatospora sp. NBC_01302]|uniref:DUF6479 family protein n=1 Tax=Kitasatospora sp. NBC_01302 TaxID=2903575 RepID=UPI002E157CA6|nr:DUF6479 family protein [Kitasatospora sp. NBC_01302]
MTSAVRLIAADVSQALLVMVVPTLIIFGALIGAFVWGSRRRARHQPPPTRPVDAAGPEPGSWQTPGAGPDPAVRGGGPGRPSARGGSHRRRPR